MRTKMFLRIICYCLFVFATAAVWAADDARPNILMLIADDLGSADLGCFGNTTLRTPRIDQLAKEGVILTQHVTADSVCTPNRAAFYTGRYPKRFGMVSSRYVSINLFLAISGGFPPNETTIAQVAKRAGYRTALIGKWHLGLNCETYGDWCHHPQKLGFDYYYGLPLTNVHDFGDDGLAIFWQNRPLWSAILSNSAIISLLTSVLLLYYRFHPLAVLLFFLLFSAIPGSLYLIFDNLRMLNGVLMRGFEIVEQPIVLSDLTPRLVAEGSQFIESSVAAKEPFFVVMSWIQVHTALITMPQFRNRSQHGPYGDAVEELDWSVGKMLDVLDLLGVADNTFVYFASDNAAHIEDTNAQGERHGGYNGKLRGGKFHSGLEGAVRVPGLIRWKKGIPSGGLAVPQTTVNIDIFPTVAGLMNQKQDDPKFPIDGRDLMPLLRNPSPSNPNIHDFVFHYCGEFLHSVRYIPKSSTAVYKYHLFMPDRMNGTDVCLNFCACTNGVLQNPPKLYDISKDETESNPIDPSSQLYKEAQVAIDRAIEEHKTSLDPNVPSQFSWRNQLWRPWLQPCCGPYPFPFCGCRDEQNISHVIGDFNLA